MTGVQTCALPIFIVKSYLQALLDDSSDLKYAPRQREINWMEEGHDKVMAQIELDYDKEIDSIKKYESQKIAEYNKLYGTKYTTIGELPQSVREPIQDVVSQRTANAESKKENAGSSYYNGILQQYDDFEQQRLNISKKYAQDRETLNKKDTEVSERTAPSFIVLASSKLPAILVFGLATQLKEKLRSL